MMKDEDLPFRDLEDEAAERVGSWHSIELGDLERQWRVAEEVLRIAEVTGWTLASCATLTSYLMWSSDFLALTAFAVIYGITVRPYERDRKLAEDALERATGVRRRSRIGDPFGG